MLDSYHLREKFNQAQVQGNWAKIMGNTIAKYTTDVYVKDKVLHLYISSAALKNELLIMKEKVIERVNEALEREVITDVIIR